MKIGRNDPCPCGSGKKWKHCHLGTQYQPRVTEGEVKSFASSHKISKECLHPESNLGTCKGQIIDAHTVQKNGSLKKIALDGKVYQFKPDVNALFRTNGKFELKTLGIGQASTFPGFCKHHDHQLFSPIENNAFESNEKHTFLFGFRALCKEIYAKKLQHEGMPFLKGMDKGLTLETQMKLQNFLAYYQRGIQSGLNNLLHYKTAYDDAFINDNFESMKFLVIRFNSDPFLMSSGAIYPEFDFDGKELQVLGRKEKHSLMTVNACSTPEGGAVIFQWVGDDTINLQLVRSFLKIPQSNWGNVFTQFAFESFENLFISPSWWDSLSKDTKTRLQNRMQCGVGHKKRHQGNCFIPDGVEYGFWNVTGAQANVDI